MSTIVVAIKPLTVNQAWQGKRYKTKEYKAFEKQALLMLPPKVDIPEGRLSIELEFGVSNTQCDWDNPIKAFVDILQKKYGFNDNRIYFGSVRKRIVPKSSEYIKFKLESYTETE